MKFETELKKLGLGDKEAAVYLASLELGAAPVQVIARKAKVVRATTYVVLEALMKEGLVTTYKEGKKTLFAAEAPHQLLRLLEKEQDVIQEKKHDLEKILPELQALVKAEGIPSVRYFDGKEGLHAIRQEINMYSQPGDMIYNFTPADHLTSVFPVGEENDYAQRVGRGILAKTIFTTKSPKLKDGWLFAPEQSRLSERRYVPAETFAFTSGMTIYGDRIAIGSFTGKIMGVVIESKSMSDMMKRIFELAWIGAQHVPGSEDGKSFLNP